MKSTSKNTKWKIPLYKVHVNKTDTQYVNSVIKKGMNWALGPEIISLEKKLAKLVGLKHCVSFNSGTSAGHAVMIAMNLQKSQVLVPSFSFIATANWPLMVNAYPKFIDIEEDTLGMDPNQIEQKISPRVKAVMPIHFAGLPCKIDEIASIAKKNKIKLIEDCAESLGSSIKNKKSGSFGDATILSFAGNKVLTAGEGGAVLTNSDKLFEKLKLIRSHGRKTSENYFLSSKNPKYITLGYNWRMSTITAALALSQLENLDFLIKKRQENVDYMIKNLKKCEQIKFHSAPKNFIHVNQLFPIILPNSKIRNNLMSFLTTKGIMSKIFFTPIHKSPHFKKLNVSSSNLLITEKISNTIMSLPLFPDLTKKEMNFITDSVSEFFELSNS